MTSLEDAALAYARVECELEDAQRAFMPRGLRALIEARLETVSQDLKRTAREMHDFDPHAHLQAKLAHARFAPTPVTASEWCQRMQDLRDIKPRPATKLYGAPRVL